MIRRVRAEQLDRKIEVLERSQGQDPEDGSPVETWQPFATLFAQVEDVPTSKSEEVIDGINLGRRPCKVRTHYRDDITTDMRFELDGRTLRIIGPPIEIGRRDGIEFSAEELTTEGDEP